MYVGIGFQNTVVAGDASVVRVGSGSAGGAHQFCVSAGGRVSGRGAGVGRGGQIIEGEGLAQRLDEHSRCPLLPPSPSAHAPPCRAALPC